MRPVEREDTVLAQYKAMVHSDPHSEGFNEVVFANSLYRLLPHLQSNVDGDGDHRFDVLLPCPYDDEGRCPFDRGHPDHGIVKIHRTGVPVGDVEVLA
ncbi:hypothetical protein [Streptomyces sp. NPDC007205]|uniref:hypothetical protein n=1 Tax=Streptomyces sp. NPDC007205 TaxID=3154316 RepID=UPI0033FEF635